MKWFWGFLLMVTLILALDYGLTRYGEYRERVKREREMRKFCFSAFDYGREKKL